MPRNLQILRENRGLSRERVGEMVGVSQEKIAEWEAAEAEISKPVLHRLAILFDVRDPYSLLRGDGMGLGQPAENGMSSNDAGVDDALNAFRHQLETLTERELLPLDTDTIEFCVNAMRRQIEEEDKQNRGTAP